MGKHPEHALHRKVWTLGGTFSFHIILQVDPCACTDECSAWFGCFKQRATCYAEQTVNLSWEFCWVRGSAKMVSHVRLSKIANSFPLSHCRVSLSIKSTTFISCEGVFKKPGGWGSQEWDATEIFLPSPIIPLDPAWIISLAANNERHTNEGLLPNSASKKELFGK